MQNRIGLVFDFDDTLAPDSTSSFLENLGIDVPHFWNKEVKPLLDDDWDPIPAYLYKMIEYSQNGRCLPITKEMLSAWGQNIVYHEGVKLIFNRIKEHAKKISPEVEVEFYIISSGIGDILRNTAIARHFTGIWASEFSYNPKGEIAFPKKVVSFTDKTRYLFQISKGMIGPKYFGKPFDVNQKVSREELRIPIEQMIYIGDGYTDIPCFSLVKKNYGIAIGVYDRKNREKWGRAWGFIEDGRVSNLLSANFSAGSDLTNTLFMAVENICGKIESKLKLK